MEKIKDFLRRHKNLLLQLGALIFTVAFWYWWLGLTVTLILASTILIHEYGHVWQMRRYGMPVKGIYLTPIGGIALGAGRFKSFWEEVIISLMGPVFGLMYGGLLAGLYFVTGNETVKWAVFFIGFIHLFNFLPINPLDGGRITKSIAVSIHPTLALSIMWLGTLAALAGFFHGFGIVFLFIAFLGYQGIQEFNLFLTIKKNPAIVDMVSGDLQDDLRTFANMPYLTPKEISLASLYYVLLIACALALFIYFVPNDATTVLSQVTQRSW